MTHEITNEVTTKGIGWLASVWPLLQAVFVAIASWVAVSVGKYFVSKKEIAHLDAKEKEEKINEIGRQRLTTLVADALHYVEETVIRPGKAQGKDAKKDKEFREEAHKALVAFVRNMADKYNVDWIVHNFSDEQIIQFAESILNVFRKSGRL